jgi:hypothetical protein
MRFDSIAAYMFAADIYCPEHISEALASHGFPVAPGELGNAEAAETMLDDLARVRGIDREREETFDSGEFPKVILYGTIDRAEYCGSTHHPHVIEDTERFGDPDAEEESECPGHPAGPFDSMGETTFCDGSCQ